MNVLDGGGITSPQGFEAAGIHCGIKSDPQNKDLALVHSTAMARGAAVYTKNRVQAAPIAVDRHHLENGSARAVVLNSGNANACTGDRGLADARHMCATTAAALGIEASDVLVCSTGVIGVELPMSAIEAGIPKVARALSPSGGLAAAEAIMTTDTVPKQCAVEVDVAGTPVRVGAIAKGAAMIAPNMATMLAVVGTDAAVSPDLLQEMLTDAVQRSFNCITVDGDMSTNDTVILLANGATGAPEIGEREAGNLYSGIEFVCREMARAIAGDAEGKSTLIRIQVNGGTSEPEARQVGLSVANSNLVSTTVFGNDPNWGRILCAVGYSGVDVDPSRTDVKLCGTTIYTGGAGATFDAEQLSAAMAAPEVDIEIDLNMGSACAEIFTSDLTYEYVRLNAEYTT